MMMHLSKSDERLFQRIEAFAMQHHDRYTLGATFTDGRPKAVCYNNIDGTRHVAEHLESLNALPNLLSQCIEPLIPLLTRRNEVKYLSVRSGYPGNRLLSLHQNRVASRWCTTSTLARQLERNTLIRWIRWQKHIKNI